MSIALIPIETVLEQAGCRDLVPSFSFADTASPLIRLLRLQCGGRLNADDRQGPQTADDSHYGLCKDALRVARETEADVLLTPEYSFPLELIGEMAADPRLQPPPGKLWCLACQGEERSRFLDRLGGWGERARVFRPAGNVVWRDFVCALVYAFMGSDGHTLCIAPQLKLHASGDPELYCEGDALSRGSAVYTFGSERANRLCSIICADAFHPDMNAGLLFNEGAGDWIVLHPQLNKRPRHSYMVRLRDAIFSRTEGRRTVYVTANWAESTEVRLPQSSLEIAAPWSCVYMKHSGEWLSSLRTARNDSMPKGLGFAYWDEAKVKVWYAHKREHLQLVAIEKPNPATVEANAVPAGAKALRVYVPDEQRREWREADLPFDDRLPDPLTAAATGSFDFPLRASIEKRDRFFGLCLGHGEDGQLRFAADGGGREISMRLGLHIDDDCEPLRNEDADRVGKLIDCLRAESERLPGQLRHLEGRFRFRLADDYPHFNLFPDEGEERDGVWVAYARTEHKAQEMAVQLCRRVGKDYEHQVCVFSTKTGSHETVAYPVRSVEYTSPAKVRTSVEFTDGGNRAWNR
ncbi:hypothetical protein [Paenibacillus sp. GYB003]|uniref:hypothetical protein n=1 Tax=Paenibacillus sp. GYB003 TaxID=2994392 RepID=UPI002F96D25E